MNGYQKRCHCGRFMVPRLLAARLQEAAKVRAGKRRAAGAMLAASQGPSAKAQRARSDIAEIVRKVFAIDGMSLVITIAYTNVL